MRTVKRAAKIKRRNQKTPHGAAQRGWPVNLNDFETAAKRRLTPMAFAYIAGGAGDERTMRRNSEAFAGIRVKPRVLVDVSRVETTVEVLGQTLAHPILLAPTAYHKLVHPEGELATARGAAAAGATLVVSSYSTTAIEDIIEDISDLGDLGRATTQPLWFQLYVHPDRGFTRDLVLRAEAAGCRAICITVDSPVFGARNREARTGFHLPAGISAVHLEPLGAAAQKAGHVTSDGVYSPVTDAALVWKDISWLCSLTKAPVILKGILTAEDARLAIDHGAAGIIVSNHGGRNLDTVPATIEALPGVAEAVDGRIIVLLDGGIRRGTDVLKAMALGAKAVLIGRPYVWGLAVGGAAGVSEVVRILRDELRAAMALCGISKIASITRDVIWRDGP
jgi:4-hydroxymandelate oxidase